MNALTSPSPNGTSVMTWFIRTDVRRRCRVAFVFLTDLLGLDDPLFGHELVLRHWDSPLGVGYRPPGPGEPPCRRVG